MLIYNTATTGLHHSVEIHAMNDALRTFVGIYPLIAYRIKGIDRIETEIGMNLGSILPHKNEIKEKSKGKDTASLWKTYFTFLDRLNKTISVAKNIKKLGGRELMKLLGISNS